MSEAFTSSSSVSSESRSPSSSSPFVMSYKTSRHENLTPSFAKYVSSSSLLVLKSVFVSYARMPLNRGCGDDEEGRDAEKTATPSRSETILNVIKSSASLSAKDDEEEEESRERPNFKGRALESEHE